MRHVSELVQAWLDSQEQTPPIQKASLNVTSLCETLTTSTTSLFNTTVAARNSFASALRAATIRYLTAYLYALGSAILSALPPQEDEQGSLFSPSDAAIMLLDFRKKPASRSSAQDWIALAKRLASGRFCELFSWPSASLPDWDRMNDRLLAQLPNLPPFDKSLAVFAIASTGQGSHHLFSATYLRTPLTDRNGPSQAFLAGVLLGDTEALALRSITRLLDIELMLQQTSLDTEPLITFVEVVAELTTHLQTLKSLRHLFTLLLALPPERQPPVNILDFNQAIELAIDMEALPYLWALLEYLQTAGNSMNTSFSLAAAHIAQIANLDLFSTFLERYRIIPGILPYICHAISKNSIISGDDAPPLDEGDDENGDPVLEIDGGAPPENWIPQDQHPLWVDALQGFFSLEELAAPGVIPPDTWLWDIVQARLAAAQNAAAAIE